MKKWWIYGTVLAASFLFGCTDTDTPSNNNNQNNENTHNNNNTQNNNNLIEKALTASDLTTLSDAETADYTKALNTFSLDMSDRLFEAGKNTVFSGFSLHTAFDMLYQGSVDEAKNELSRHMGFNADLEQQAKLGSGMRNLLRFDGQLENAKMTIANRIFADKGYKINDKFAQVLSKYYHAPVEVVEFTNKEATAKTINDYVKANTMDMIERIVNPDDLNDIKLSLVNTIALRAKWANAFPAHDTAGETFTTADGSTVTMDFMKAGREMHYYKVEGKYESVRLDFVGDKYQMFFVLPEGKVEELKFTADTFAEMHKNLNTGETTKILLSLPKAKIDSGIMFLTDKLKDMGVKEVFLGGLTNVGDKNPHVTSVVQKAIIEWNEEETKAAAVTAIGVDIVSVPDGKAVSFNRPFAFYLVHKASGAILFNGRLVK